MSAHPANTMALLCAVGGTIGFVRRRSVPSLVAGLGVAALFGVAGQRIRNGQDYGHELAFAAGLILFASSAGRFKAGPIPKLLTVTGGAAGAYYGYYTALLHQTR